MIGVQDPTDGQMMRGFGFWSKRWGWNDTKWRAGSAWNWNAGRWVWRDAEWSSGSSWNWKTERWREGSSSWNEQPTVTQNAVRLSELPIARAIAIETRTRDATDRAEASCLNSITLSELRKAIAIADKPPELEAARLQFQRDKILLVTNAISGNMYRLCLDPFVETPNSFVSARQLYAVLRLAIPQLPRSASLDLWYESGSGESLSQVRIDSSVKWKVEKLAGRPLFVVIQNSPSEVEDTISEPGDFAISEPGEIERRLLRGWREDEVSEPDDSEPDDFAIWPAMAQQLDVAIAGWRATRGHADRADSGH